MLNKAVLVGCTNHSPIVIDQPDRAREKGLHGRQLTSHAWKSESPTGTM